ncbi:sacsin N-terminal ATP-binding-like domain-containing protein [Streptomyces sp. NPDC059491]|uniref:sacsin N-terminal ATP-binding-like domain-containing protein n=1 Tax=Streptomyces sp. NPDC059491 TaxID=3346850 RepID=UPI0036ACC7CA
MAQQTVGVGESAEWAERLFRKTCPAGREVPEPDSAEAARAAVERFVVLDADTGVSRDSAIAGRRQAGKMSTDWLQGVSEVVQNAEDLGATEVRLQVRSGTLFLAHNGRPVRLKDVIPLSMPWLSSKADDAEAVGRFGIGLMSLLRFSPAIDLYSGFYRLRIGEEGLGHAPERSPSDVLGGEGWTVFSVPLVRRSLTAAALEEWLATWGHEALLFLRNVATVVHLDCDGAPLRRLALRRTDAGAFTAQIAGEHTTVHAGTVVDPDGRRWWVCRASVAPPPGLEPEAKAAGSSVPLAVAFPWPSDGEGEEHDGPWAGYVHARLPVTPFGLPVRVHSAFDPTPSRQDLQDTDWNAALVERVADLWAATVVERFAADPSAAWALPPLPDRPPGPGHTGVVGLIEAALFDRSRSSVCGGLRIGGPGGVARALEDLAVEVPELTGITTAAEIGRLAGATMLPVGARDGDGRYRAVLEDWSEHGEAAPRTVSSWDARVLLEEADRGPESTIELAAAILTAGWGSTLTGYRWVADAAGVRHRPPRDGELRVLADRPGSLAESLGFAQVLHPAFRAGTPAAACVRTWLTERRALLVDGDHLTALRRLADHGRTRASSAEALRLTDEQLRLLKDTFARLDEGDRKRLGEDVGRAVALGAYAYTLDGRRLERWAPVATSFLPVGLDRAERAESFAFAAGGTPGLAWLRPRYSEVLRRSGSGLGAAEFLRVLGAASAPRIRLHGGSVLRLHRHGVPALVHGSPKSRSSRMGALGAEYTLDDREAPDLDAVARAIAAEPDPDLRRKRAVALIHVLGRAWESRYAEHAQVTAAEAYRRWYEKEKVPGFWLWRLREIRWLDNEAGVPAAPAELRRRTEATALVYGSDADGILHPGIQEAVGRRGQVLKALGVGGEPTTGDLVDRLRRLRRAELDGAPGDMSAAILLLRVLAARTIPLRAPVGDLSRGDVVRAFSEGPGLVRTEAGWRPPSLCLRGEPIFGPLRPFAPRLGDADVLWQTLGVPEPSADDAIDVIRQLSRLSPGGTSPAAGAADGVEALPESVVQAVLLQSLQFLQTLAAGRPDTLKGRSLRRLPVMTNRGWVRRRPVFAVADEALADRLGEALSEAGGAVWRPGTDIEHLMDVSGRLGVTILGSDDMTPRVGGPPRPHADATARFGAAVAHLREDLQRRDPLTARELSGAWTDLTALVVCVEPALSVAVALPDATVVEVSARAAIDAAEGILFVSDPAEIGRYGSVGQAVAARFGSRRREAAYAWPVAWERAEAGHAAVDLTRAEDRVTALNAAADAAARQRVNAFREANLARHAPSSGRSAAGASSPPATVPRAPATDLASSPPGDAGRRLIEPSRWRPVLSARAPADQGRTPVSPPRGPGRPVLTTPGAQAAVPRPRQGARGFTTDDQEKAALDLLRAALARDPEELRDLRARRGLGADALDDQSAFYELKTTLGAEQDSVYLTLHEYERALTEEDFHLVVVSGLEHGAGFAPTVRVILDPLRHLVVRSDPRIQLTGVRSCPSLPIHFEPAD